MADDAIDWMNRVNQVDPSKPFFLYYVPGATHAPHHPTKEWKVDRPKLLPEDVKKLEAAQRNNKVSE